MFISTPVEKIWEMAQGQPFELILEESIPSMMRDVIVFTEMEIHS